MYDNPPLPCVYLNYIQIYLGFKDDTTNIDFMDIVDSMFIIYMFNLFCFGMSYLSL